MSESFFSAQKALVLKDKQPLLFFWLFLTHPPALPPLHLSSSSLIINIHTDRTQKTIRKGMQNVYREQFKCI